MVIITTFNVTDSVFKNIRAGSNCVIRFGFENWEASTSTIIMENVTFVNITADASHDNYGLIYVQDQFNIQINNCEFLYNKQFTSLIFCGAYSYCNVTIQDATFVDNDGGYYLGVLYFVLSRSVVW